MDFMPSFAKQDRPGRDRQQECRERQHAERVWLSMRDGHLKMLVGLTTNRQVLINAFRIFSNTFAAALLPGAVSFKKIAFFVA
jgi:hypothetical protein